MQPDSLIRGIGLMSNDGKGGEGDMYELTPHLTEIGSIQWEVDKQLTRMSPGTMTLSIADPQELLWKWLERQVFAKDGALPPWLF